MALQEQRVLTCALLGLAIRVILPYAYMGFYLLPVMSDAVWDNDKIRIYANLLIFILMTFVSSGVNVFAFFSNGRLL